MERLASFLLGPEDDRHRHAEVEAAMDRARGVSAVAIVAAVPLFAEGRGTWPLLLAAAWIAWSQLVRIRSKRSDHPGLWILSLTCVTQLAFAVGAVATGGPTSPVLLWLVLALVTAPARYTTRGVIVAGIWSTFCLLVPSVWHGLGTLASAPQIPAITLSCGIGCLAYALALRSAEDTQRVAASVDPLTGLRNRAALRARFTTLSAAGAADQHAVLGLLVCDLDHFKAINDAHGHDIGDEVLVDVAAILRDAIPADAAAYRLGGEEFLVLLPGADAQHVAIAAERLRARVGAARPGGRAVTMSIGGTTATGAAIDEAAMFRAADRALYDAKHAGRDRVVVCPPPAADLRISA